MNSEIQFTGGINKDVLSEDHYFVSLVEEAASKGLLSRKRFNSLQTEVYSLVVYRARKFLGDKSTSLPKETLLTIMNSCIYTLGVYLKSFDSPAAALEALKTTSLMELYKSGRKLIGSKIRAGKHLYRMVMDSMVKVDNYIYKSTLDDGIHGFFKKYDGDFEADNAIITADYPLLCENRNLSGIEFIVSYLGCAYYENLFCRKFETEDIHHLLLGYNESYRDQVFNIYQQVLSCALGCSLSGASVKDLVISSDSLMRIERVLKGRDVKDIREILINSLEVIIKDLDIDNEGLISYLMKSVDIITGEVAVAMDIGKLQRVFIMAVIPQDKNTINFSVGTPMDDEKYRSLVDEIIRCRYVSDKIAIIKEEITSLRDLKDILLDGELDENEIYEVLRTLDDSEIAPLMKLVLPYTQSPDDLREEEQLLLSAIKEYVSALPKDTALNIWNTYRIIEVD